MIPTWPGALPDSLLISGYSSGEKDVILSSSMEVGPAKVRRRNTAGIRPLSGRMMLTSTELQTLRAFYNDSTLSGAIRFSWKAPETDDVVEMRFTSPPQWTAVGAGNYLTSLNLEILP